MILALFDIDGTLVDTGGAGGRAFSAALYEAAGLRDGLEHVSLAGNTDLCILSEALDGGGLDPFRRGEELRFFARYVAMLREELASPDSGYRVLGGVVELLDRLDQDPTVCLGLGTGNLESGARAKLEPGKLNRFFSFGGFGSDHRDRTELLKRGIEKGQEYAQTKFEEVFVVGDTPSDILHGRRAGARVVAVASGSFSSEELADHSPDLLLESLVPAGPFLHFLGLGREVA